MPAVVVTWTVPMQVLVPLAAMARLVLNSNPVMMVLRMLVVLATLIALLPVLVPLAVMAPLVLN